MSSTSGRLTEIGDGLSIHHHDLGTGPAVVFLHGSGPGASAWSNFGANAQALVAGGYRTILIDSLGYGGSSKPLDASYSLSFMAGGALRLLDALDIERFTLVGNSQGGAQAIWLALEVPERVERLVLMAPGGLETREVYMQMRGIRSMLRCIFGPEGITLDGMRRVFQRQLFNPALLSEAVLAERFALATSQPRRVFETLRVDNLEDRLGEIACPVLGLWGMNDLFCPPSGAVKLAERCPQARVTLLGRCGHWVMVEHPDTFNRLTLDFLQHG